MSVVSLANNWFKYYVPKKSCPIASYYIKWAKTWGNNIQYWVALKIPQICTVILPIRIGKIA